MHPVENRAGYVCVIEEKQDARGDFSIRRWDVSVNERGEFFNGRYCEPDSNGGITRPPFPSGRRTSEVTPEELGDIAEYVVRARDIAMAKDRTSTLPMIQRPALREIGKNPGAGRGL